MAKSVVSACESGNPFAFLAIDGSEQGALMAEAMLARRDGAQILLAAAAALQAPMSDETAGFLAAIQARLVDGSRLP